MRRNLRGAFSSYIQKTFFHNITVGHSNLKIPDFILRKEPGFLRLAADTDGTFLIHFQRKHNDHHSPDTAILKCCNPSRSTVYLYFPELIPFDPPAQFLKYLPGHGLVRIFPLLAAAADQSPSVGVPALLQKQFSVAGNDAVRTQMCRHIGLGRIGII